MWPASIPEGRRATKKCVLIVDDHAELRRRTRLMIALDENFEVIDEAADSTAAADEAWT